ncbi:armadillo-type protein [Mycena latifolia]|nr:armadillo-type protein [Mycena latifolia]
MHHPLTRQQTRDSLHSWWSDRNPVGPTIDLHAAAKPLMRFMYRRDALALIAKNRGIPLSSEDMDIYSSYLAYKYVSSSTKTAILVELETRLDSEDDARAVADSFVLHLADEFLSSSDTPICKSMCRILGLLAHRETAIPAILRWTPCKQLVSLLSAVDIEVVMGAAETLSSIAQCVEGAQAIADAKVFDSFAKLLESPNEKVQKWPREIMGELVRHDTTARAATGAIVSLLRSRNITVTKCAANVVDHIITFPLGAQALVAENILDAVAPLLDDNPMRDSQMRDWTCRMLKILAAEPATVTVVSAHLVVVCRHGNSELVESAAEVLSSISISPGGARATVDANVLECVHTLLQSPSTGVRKWTCDMLRQLVHHTTTAEAAVDHIAYLLRSKDPKVVENAARILYQSADSFGSAQAIMDTNVLQCVSDLLQSQETGVRKWTWSLLDESARHEITTRAAVEQMVSLIRGDDVRLVRDAAHRLWQTSKSPAGAQAAVDAHVIEYLPALVESPNAWIQRFTLGLLEELVRHESTASVAICEIISLCRIPAVTTSAIHMLDHILASPHGAQTLVDAKILDSTDVLLVNSQTLDCTCEMLKRLADQPSMTKLVLERLVFLLHPGNLDVVIGAAKALNWIAKSPEGANAALDANVLEFFPALLELPHARVWIGTWDIVETLLRHQLATKPIAQYIVSLFSGGRLAQTNLKHAAQILGGIISAPQGDVALMDIDMKAAVRQLVLLLRHDKYDVVLGAAKVLCSIATSPEGANAALDANILECFFELLELPHARVWIGTWDIVKTLLRHQLAAKPIAQYIVSLFRGWRLTKTKLKHAAHILDDIIRAPQGDVALMDIDMYGCVAVLLQLPNNASPTWYWMWWKLRKVASEQPTTKAVVGQLVLLLRHDKFGVAEDAAKVLCSIATSPEVAQAVVDLDCVVELLDSANTGVKVWTCELLANAAYPQSARDRALRVKPCMQLVSLLRDRDPVVVERSARTLSRIARVEEGAQAAVDAKVLDCVEELLDSPNTMVCLWTSKILGELALHKAIVPAILAVNPCPQLVFLMQHTAGVSGSTSDYCPVRTAALSALTRISESPDGAAAVAGTQFMVYASDLTDHEINNCEGSCGEHTRAPRNTEDYDPYGQRDFAAALPLPHAAAVNFAAVVEYTLNTPPGPQLPWHCIP